jgi:hypothetical protein
VRASAGVEARVDEDPRRREPLDEWLDDERNRLPIHVAGGTGR